MLEIIYPQRKPTLYLQEQYNPVLKLVKCKPITIWNVVVGETNGTVGPGCKVYKRR